MFRLCVELDDQKVDIPRVAMRELVAFERHFGASAGVLKEGRLEHAAYLAWLGLQRVGAINGEAFDDAFLDRLGLIEVSEAVPSPAIDEMAPTPTSPGSPSPAV